MEGAQGVLHQNFKMGLIGNSEQQAGAKRLVREFFKHLYSEFIISRQGLGVYPHLKTYVSYPAKWTSETRSLMKQCAMEAGFGNENNVFGENEPTAAIFAAIAANMENLQREHIIIRNRPVNVMMLDMGAGTSDIAIFKFKIDDNNKPVINELITYPAIDNVYFCGGSEVDRLLADYLIEYVRNISNNNQVPSGIKEMINGRVKFWKERSVSSVLKNNGRVNFPGDLEPALNFMKQNGILKDMPFEGIGRRQFELLTQPHWQQLRSLIADSINEAKNRLHDFNGAGDIDLVVLSGGHSLWYGVTEFILGNNFAGLDPLHFSKIEQQPQRLLRETHPQETVATGLVYKDMPFDVKYTMGSSLWVRYTVEGKQSPIIPIAKHNDVLPISQHANFNEVVAGTLFRTDSIPVKCEFLFGSSTATAKTYTIMKKVPMPDVVLNYIIGVLLGSPIAVGKFIYDWVQYNWDIAVAKTPELFQENYKVIITSDVNISEEEAVNINGELKIGGNSAHIPFTIKIG